MSRIMESGGHFAKERVEAARRRVRQRRETLGSESGDKAPHEVSSGSGLREHERQEGIRQDVLEEDDPQSEEPIRADASPGLHAGKAEDREHKRAREEREEDSREAGTARTP